MKESQINPSNTYPSKQITEVSHKSHIPQQFHRNNHRCHCVVGSVAGPAADADPGCGSTRRRHPTAAEAGSVLGAADADTATTAAEAASPTAASAVGEAANDDAICGEKKDGARERERERERN
jgi:hypothetical protein